MLARKEDLSMRMKLQIQALQRDLQLETSKRQVLQLQLENKLTQQPILPNMGQVRIKKNNRQKPSYLPKHDV